MNHYLDLGYSLLDIGYSKDYSAVKGNAGAGFLSSIGHLSQELTDGKDKIPGLLNPDGIGFWKIVPGIEGYQIGAVFL